MAARVGAPMSRTRPVGLSKPNAKSRDDPVSRRDDVVQEVVAHLQANREAIRREWLAEMGRRGFARSLAPDEADAESARVYDALLECLETGRYHSVQAYAQDMAERDVFRGIGAKQVIGRLLVLRDVCGRALCDPGSSGKIAKGFPGLDAYEPVVNRMLTIVAMAFLQERERAVGRGRDQLGALVEAGKLLTAERSLAALLQRIVEVACRLLGAQYGALGTVDGAGKLEHFVTTGVDDETRGRIGSLPTGKGILGVVLQERRPIRIPDLSVDPRSKGFPTHHPPMRSFLGVPIISRGRVFGHLYLTNKQGAEEFSKEDEQLAVTLAGQAAVAIENVSLYEEVRRSYEELKQSQDLLVRQEKLASLGRLAAGVAHELNNPLSAAAGFAEALQRHVSDGECAGDRRFGDCRDYLMMMQAEVARAAAIVRRLLDFARQREPEFGPVALVGVVREAIAFVERQARLANRRIALSPMDEGIVVQGDAQMLHQVFLNLLTNALDAVESGGDVSVVIRDVSGVVQGHGAADATRWVDVVVSDTGIGIAPEHLNKVFDPFFTTKEVGKGTGLGLAVCQGIVEQHGGTIAVRSAGVGKGTEVLVRLPRARAGHS